MTGQSDRLQTARKNAGFTSAKEAAEALGIPVASYIQHENGTRGFKKERAEQYARRFKVSVEWLMFAKGVAEAAPALPSEDELAAMLASAQSEIQAGISIGDWPHAVASSLRTQLERYLADRAGASIAKSATSRGKSAQSPAPTKQGVRE